MMLNLIFLEGGNYDAIVYLILLILLGPPLFLGVIGLVLFKNNSKKAGKVFFILGGIYLVVGLGICGALLS